MDYQRGDDYLPRLAEAALQRRRRPRQSQPPSSGLTLNPLQWFSSDNTRQSTRPKPLMFYIDTHHLFYILTRLEALRYNVGSLDAKVIAPSRPMNYVDVFHGEDTSDTISLSSIRTSLSTVSRLSLGVGLWGRPEPPSLDQELKYIFSSFTKIPALSLRAPGPKQIAEVAGDPPNENALPLDVFRNLQSLECIDIDPRALLGWGRLSESLWSLTVVRSGLDDISDLFIDAVTPLPETIAESVEETVETPTSDDLPRRPFLSLCDNSLTFIPTESLLHLTSLIHLDLSSNLLVSIPTGLSSLYNLVSLTLCAGIYKKLGQVLKIDISHNRLDSLAGLERLVALERVNVGHNRLEESGEVGRLALLPNIAEVCVEGNPFTEIESDYRVKCFDFFWKEGKTILLDGSQAGFYEKLNLTSQPPEQMSSTRSISKAHSPSTVPVGVATTAAIAVPPDASNRASPSSSPAFSPSSSHHPSPFLAATSPKARKKRVKRIVDLDADSSGDTTRLSVTRSEETSEYSGDPTVLTRSPRAEPTSIPSATEPAVNTATPRSTVHPPPLDVAGLVSKHRRSQTEHTPASATAESGTSSPVLSHSPSERTMSVRVSSRRSAARRGRVAASVFETPITKPDDVLMEEGKEGEIKEGDAFRARIEALRSEMGDGWLKVFTQSNATQRAGVSG
ncbi:hypothetical protein BGY98DRAFT_1007045 [Russula aff. rugulosa BPL654]|nr:hypothetical protein BGY98DRAFT_1007045 [Russula aff. rugulosa BPL654]